MGGSVFAQEELTFAIPSYFGTPETIDLAAIIDSFDGRIASFEKLRCLIIRTWGGRAVCQLCAGWLLEGPVSECPPKATFTLDARRAGWPIG